MDITKDEKDIAVLTNRVNNIEANITDIKADLRGIRNVIMVVSLAAVGAMAVLLNQIHSLTLEVNTVSYKQESLARDVKNLENKVDAQSTKLDFIVEAVKTKDK